MREDRLVRGALGVVFLSGALLATPAIADAAIKIKKVDSATATISKSGKLVSKKNGEKLKGFKVYKSVLYENGRKYTGVINKTYFKNGVLATALYKKGIL